MWQVPGWAKALITTRDGAVELENDYLVATIEPLHGGRLSSLLWKKTGEQLIFAPSVTEAVVWANDTRQSLTDTVFTVATQSTAQGAACTLTSPLPKSPLPMPHPSLTTDTPYFPEWDTSTISLEKCYLLPDNAAGLRVRYRLTNTGIRPVGCCLAFRQTLGGEKIADERLIYAGEDGVLSFPAGMNEQQMNGSIHFAGRPYYDNLPCAESWLACQLAKGTGAARWFDPRCLSSLRIFGDGSLQSEAVSTEMQLAPGKSWEIESALLPVSGLTDLRFSGVNLLGGLPITQAPQSLRSEEGVTMTDDSFTDAPEDPDNIEATLEGNDPYLGYPVKKTISGQAQLFATEPLDADVVVTAHRLPAVAGSVAGKQHVKLLPGKLTDVPYAFTPVDEGTWVITVAVTDAQGKSLATWERTILVGESSGLYERPASVPRLGAIHRVAAKAFPPPVETQPVRDVVTPHLPIATHYARGGVRALFLAPMWAARGVVEIAQQMDLTYDFMPLGRGAYQATLEKKHATLAEQQQLKRLLLRPHEVIVAAHSWVYWPEPLRREILRQVRNEGVGLVGWDLGEYELKGLGHSFDVNGELYHINPNARSWELNVLQKNALMQNVDFPGDGTSMVNYGKGRILFLGQPGTIPTLQKESRTDRPVRAILWAARREPALTLACQLPDQVDNTGVLPAGKITLNNAGATEIAGKMEVVVRQALEARYPKLYAPLYQYYALPWWEDRAHLFQDIRVAAKGATTVTVNLPGLPAGAYTVQAVVRDAKEQTISWHTTPLEVRSGVAVDELWLSKAGGQPQRADYATAPLPVLGCVPGDTLTVRAVLTREAGVARLPLQCALRLVDTAGRIIFDEKKPVAEHTGQATFTVPLTNALHRALFIVATAWTADKPLAETRAVLPLRIPTEREPFFRILQQGTERVQPLSRLGISDLTDGDNRELAVSCLLQDTQFQGWGGYLDTAGFTGKPAKTTPKDPDTAPDPENPDVPPTTAPDPGMMRRPFCVNSPDTRAKALTRAREQLAFYGQLGLQQQFIADGFDYGSLQACQCDDCQVAFRKYLQQRYGTLERVNQEYGVHNTTWDDFTIYTLPTTAPLPRQEWPRALDTLAWKAAQIADFSAEIATLGRDTAGSLTFGFNNLPPMSPSNGVDYWALSQVSNYNMVTSDLLVWESFCGPLTTRYWRWFANKYNPYQQRHFPWEILFHGEPGTGVTTSNGFPTCQPDGSVFAGPGAFLENAAEINRGPARLLLGHDARDDVAIHWSAASFYAATFDAWEWQATRKPGTPVNKTRTINLPRGVAQFLQTAIPGPHSLAPTYLSSGQLEAGNLGRWQQPKLLFLTAATAMSPEEVDKLKRFVRDGGTLVADLTPAVRDAHGKAYPTPLLNEVFGITQRGEPQPPLFSSGRSPSSITPVDASTVKPGIKVQIGGGITPALTLYPLVLDAGNVQATTAQAWGSYPAGAATCPAVLVNKYGKGQAVLLNFLLLPRNDLTGEAWSLDNDDAGKTLVRQLCAMAGVAPWATVTVNGQPGGVRLNRFEDGANVYLGVLEDWGHVADYYTNRKTVVTLPKSYYLYDVRRGSYLGYTAVIPAAFTQNWFANLYACLPYKVTGLKVDQPPPGKPGVDIPITATILADAQPGRHVVRLEVSDPAGTPSSTYSYDVEAPNGVARFHIPLALNDPTGVWKIKCTDVATGVSAGGVITVAK